MDTPGGDRLLQGCIYIRYRVWPSQGPIYLGQIPCDGKTGQEIGRTTHRILHLFLSHVSTSVQED